MKPTWAEPARGPLPRAWAEIDLQAIADNVARLRVAAGHAELMGIVKADAYGHGLVPVSRAVRAAGASWLGVALLAEALRLREVGDDGPILAWLYAPGEDFRPAVARGVDLGVGALWMLSEIRAAAREVGVPARVQLKVDTGLARSGIAATDWPGLCAAAAAASATGELEITGIWSHLAYADEPGHPTIDHQRATFDHAIGLAAGFGIEPAMCHIANSAATLTRADLRYDLVRPGISLYGLSPGSAVGSARELGLRPAMTLKTSVAITKRVGQGQGVSYGHEYVTDRESTLALLPIGYADGVQRHASGRASVMIGGRTRPIAGRVCMDQFVVDVGDDPVSEGDVAVLFGPGDDSEPTAADWAEACGTIAYEIVTCVGPRVPRIHVGGS